MSHAIERAVPGARLPMRSYSGRLAGERLLAVLVIFSVAVAVRLMLTLRGSGLFGLHFYDDGVHFAAATGLVHGRLPYRDFLLLHPPGILLVLAPFAEVARWLGDARGFALARLAFMVLGGLNALLVSHYLRAVGVVAAWLGGLFYALFWPAVYSEHTVLLEGPANTCLLGALVLLAPVATTTGRAGQSSPKATRRLVVAGGLLGFAMTIKIWGVVPVLVLTLWLLVRAGWRPAALTLLGAAAATTVVCLPFFVAAPGKMWRMIVLDQLGRNEAPVDLVQRMNQIAGLTLYRLPHQVSVAMVLAWVVLVAATLACWSKPRMRPVVVLTVALVTTLLLTPSWFVHYTALSAAVVALVVGAGAQRLVDLLAGQLGPAPRLGVAGLLVATLVGFSLPVASAKSGTHFDGRTLGSALADRPGCVTSDHAATLILMNVLSRNLERRCRLVVDLGGAHYDLPSPARGVLSRRRNKEFQAYALRYLRTGDTTCIARFHMNFGFSAKTARQVYRWPTVKRAGLYKLRRPPLPAAKSR